MKLDVSNIQQGQKFKNFKELAAAFGITKPLAGNQRKAVIKEIECCVKYSRQGNSYTIDEIFSQKRAKQDGRKKGNNTLYKDMLAHELILFLRKQERREYQCTMTRWFQLLGMANAKYAYLESQAESNLGKFDSEKEIELWDYNYFIFQTNQYLRGILNSTLDCLIREQVISVTKVAVIVDKDYQIIMEGEKEQEMIEEAKIEVYKKLGISPNSFLGYRQKQFYKELNNYIWINYSWRSCFQEIKIQLVEESNDYMLENTNENRKTLRLAIYNAMIRRIDRQLENEPLSIEKRRDRLNSNMKIGRIPESKVFKLPERFEEKQKYLVEYFMT